MGPSNALAEEFEFRPLMTDFASGPFDLCFETAGFGLGATAAAGGSAEGGCCARGADASGLTVVVVSLCSTLLDLLEPPAWPNEPKAIAADDFIDVFTDSVDFPS